MIKIDFKLIDLENEKPKKTKQAFIRLEDDYVEYVTEYFSDERDSETDDWRLNSYHYYVVVADKKAVQGVYINYRPRVDHYRVNLNMLGFTEDIFATFEDEHEAKHLFEVLREWRFKKNNHE